MHCIFSIDVEDWFHILDLPSTPPISEWQSLPSRVEANFRTLLDLMDDAHVRSTCFFLGWVAERYPHLVREARQRGHEIASHGYGHQLVYELTPEAFSADVRRARQILEDVAGCTVAGYRAPGFSVTAQTPWFFERLCEAGYRYDSSVFPASRQHGGLPGAPAYPYAVACAAGSLTEFPLTTARVFGRRLCLFGGGYLRLSPALLMSRVARQILREERPVIFYIHPREIDPLHPRLPMGPVRRFKTYVNIKGTRRKLESLFRRFEMTTFADCLASHPDLTAHREPAVIAGAER